MSHTLRMLIMQVLTSQLPFLVNRNPELPARLLFWPVNWIKVGGHVALLSGPTVFFPCGDRVNRDYYIIPI